MTHSSWGSGWPNCQGSRIVQINADGTQFPGGIRGELADLVTRLVLETKKRGYHFGSGDDPSYGCWGYSCRAISGTSSPSNHSWGLAVDINAPTNPQKRPLTTDMPAWMPDLWNSYGFRWGGDYTSSTPDAMHYEFMGSVDDAAWYTQVAIDNRLGEPDQPPPPKHPKWEEYPMTLSTNEGRLAFVGDLWLEHLGRWPDDGGQWWADQIAGAVWNAAMVGHPQPEDVGYWLGVSGIGNSEEALARRTDTENLRAKIRSATPAPPPDGGNGGDVVIPGNVVTVDDMNLIFGAAADKAAELAAASTPVAREEDDQRPRLFGRNEE